MIDSIIIFLVITCIGTWFENRRQKKVLAHLNAVIDLKIKQNEYEKRIEFLVENYDPKDTLMEPTYGKELSAEDKRYNNMLMQKYMTKHPGSKFWDDHPDFIDITEITDLLK